MKNIFFTILVLTIASISTQAGIVLRIDGKYNLQLSYNTTSNYISYNSIRYQRKVMRRRHLVTVRKEFPITKRVKVAANTNFVIDNGKEFQVPIKRYAYYHRIVIGCRVRNVQEWQFFDEVIYEPCYSVITKHITSVPANHKGVWVNFSGISIGNDNWSISYKPCHTPVNYYHHNNGFWCRRGCSNNIRPYAPQQPIIIKPSKPIDPRTIPYHQRKFRADHKVYSGGTVKPQKYHQRKFQADHKIYKK